MTDDNDDFRRQAQEAWEWARDGILADRYKIYLDLTSDNPPKTFDEWLES